SCTPRGKSAMCVVLRRLRVRRPTERPRNAVDGHSTLCQEWPNANTGAKKTNPGESEALATGESLLVGLLAPYIPIGERVDPVARRDVGVAVPVAGLVVAVIAEVGITLPILRRLEPAEEPNVLTLGVGTHRDVVGDGRVQRLNRHDGRDDGL